MFYFLWPQIGISGDLVFVLYVDLSVFEQKKKLTLAITFEP